MSGKVDKTQAIKQIVKTSVKSFAEGFKSRHEGEIDNPNGTINMKIHNIFIAVLGSEIQYYAALVRSFDSSLGNMIESMAIAIAELSFEVNKEVIGSLSRTQTEGVANLLKEYKERRLTPDVDDYQFLRDKPKEFDDKNARHDSDYYLINKKTNHHYLIELKIGGDLDNKKARSEKEALLEQFAILSNSLPTDTALSIHFATAYNRYGENQEWKQGRVLQYFAENELLISRDFWNFVCQMDNGYELVIDTYKEAAIHIKDALKSIKQTYLGDEDNDEM